MHLADVRADRHARRYAGRAAAVALGWVLAMVPAALGLQRCPAALFLHAPCPGCGMTRAIWLILRGDVDASWRMHPLAVPTVVATALVALAMVRVTYLRGAPSAMVGDAPSRAAIALFLAIQIGAVALWVARMLGAFGGPVPV